MRNFLVSFKVPESKLGTILVAADSEGFAPDSIKLMIESLTDLGQEAERLMKLRRPKQKRSAFGMRSSHLRDFILENTKDNEPFQIIDLIKIGRNKGFSDSGIRTQLHSLIASGQVEQLVKGKGATYRFLPTTASITLEPTNAE